MDFLISHEWHDSNDWVGGECYEIDATQSHGLCILVDLSKTPNFRCIVSQSSIFDHYIKFLETNNLDIDEYLSFVKQNSIFEQKGNSTELLEFTDRIIESSLSDDTKALVLFAVAKAFHSYFSI